MTKTHRWEKTERIPPEHELVNYKRLTALYLESQNNLTSVSVVFVLVLLAFEKVTLHLWGEYKRYKLSYVNGLSPLLSTQHLASAQHTKLMFCPVIGIEYHRVPKKRIMFCKLGPSCWNNEENIIIIWLKQWWEEIDF